jgi:hypothetical protein
MRKHYATMARASFGRSSDCAKSLGIRRRQIRGTQYSCYPCVRGEGNRYGWPGAAKWAQATRKQHDRLWRSAKMAQHNILSALTITSIQCAPGRCGQRSKMKPATVFDQRDTFESGSMYFVPDLGNFERNWRQPFTI